MPTAAVVTLIGVALTVVVLALYLIRIAFILKHVNFTLGTIIAGLRAIANQTEPLAPVVGEIVRDLTDVQGALEGLVKGAKTKQTFEGIVKGAETKQPS